MSSIANKLLALSVCATSVACISACGVIDEQERVQDWNDYRHFAFAAFRDSHYDVALSRYKVVLEKALVLGAHDGRVALSKNDIARVHAAMKNYQQAQDWYQQAAEVMQNHASNYQDAVILAESLEGIANTDVSLNKLPEADKDFAKALDLARKYNLPAARSIVYEYKEFLTSQGRKAEATNLEAQQHAIYQATSLSDPQANREEQYNRALRAGEEFLHKQQLKEADVQFSTAMKIANETDDLHRQAEVSVKMADMFKRAGRLDKAERLARFAVETFQGERVKQFSDAVTMLSEVLLAEKKYWEAGEAAKVVVQEARQRHTPGGQDVIQALGQLIVVQEAAGKWGAAAQSNKDIFDIVKQSKGASDAATVVSVCNTIDCCRMANDEDSARKFLDAYVGLLQNCEPDQVAAVAKAFNDFGDNCVQKNKKPTAKLFYAAVVSLSKRLPKNATESMRAQNALKSVG